MRRDRDACDAEAPRRRVEEPELGNAVMREVAEVTEKDPGAGLRRLSNRGRRCRSTVRGRRIRLAQ